MAAREQLEAIPLFKSLEPADLEELAVRFSEQTVGEGKRLCGEGAPGYSFFVLSEGGAVVTSDGELLAELGPGDFFGEVAILGGGRRSATVTTTAPTTLLVLFGTEFRELQQSHPKIAAELEAAMERRLAARP
jgi:CRP-like cAMP-binding protein